MIAIILASGRGVRMGSLTDNTPKPMLTVLDKNLIEWKLEALPSEIDKIIMVVGYKKEIIMDYFGDSWKGVPITYIVQDPINGTAGAVSLCEEHVNDKALVLMGDDIYNKDDLKKLISYNYAMLVFDEEEEGLKKKGQVVEKDGLFVGLNEGHMQTGTPSSLINTGACVISNEYFDYPLVKVSDTEYGLPHTLTQLINDFPIHIIRATKWIQITDPETLKKAEETLSKN